METFETPGHKIICKTFIGMIDNKEFTEAISKCVATLVPLGIYVSRNVRQPAYGTPGSGCMDFYVPEFDAEFIESLALKNPRFTKERISMIVATGVVTLKPLEAICVPSGIFARLAKGTALRAYNKSGVATKLQLIRGAEYVDCDYTGEIHLHVINASDEYVNVTPSMKLVQFEYGPVFTAEQVVFGSKEEMYAEFESVRGEGWQGSTGN